VLIVERGPFADRRRRSVYLRAMARGRIERLPGGSFRVKVYAGTDPVTGNAKLRLAGGPLTSDVPARLACGASEGNEARTRRL
jgi:hypothetical protein